VVDIVLDTDDLTVLGGPSKIDVELNVGATGRRGVFIFTDFVRPDSPLATFSETPVLFDLFLLIDPGSDDYLTIFQYLNQDGVLTWLPVVQLTFNVYNTARNVKFVNGVGEVQIDIFELGFGRNVPLPALQNSRLFFNVQVTPENQNPVALSIETNDLESIAVEDTENFGESITYLPVFINAVELVEGSWVPLNRTVTINMTVNLKNPSDLELGLISEESQ
jgi:hypothetical protein